MNECSGRDALLWRTCRGWAPADRYNHFPISSRYCFDESATSLSCHSRRTGRNPPRPLTVVLPAAEVSVLEFRMSNSFGFGILRFRISCLDVAQRHVRHAPCTFAFGSGHAASTSVRPAIPAFFLAVVTAKMLNSQADSHDRESGTSSASGVRRPLVSGRCHFDRRIWRSQRGPNPLVGYGQATA